MPETAGLPPSASPRALIYLLFSAFFIFPPTWRNILLFYFSEVREMPFWSYHPDGRTQNGHLTIIELKIKIV